MNKNAIIIGGTSGIGQALAELLISKDYRVGITGRRAEKLNDLKRQLGASCFTQIMDVTDFEKSTEQFKNLIQIMGSVDLAIISAGTGHHNPDLNFDLEHDTIETNVSGFINIFNAAYSIFKEQDHGHIVGISSIAALFGNSGAPSYNASKAFISNYMAGLRNKAIKENSNINITDIRPGYVDTDMAQSDHLFWVATPQKAALQIYHAIEKKKSVAYITRRWRLIAILVKLCPYWVQKRF